MAARNSLLVIPKLLFLPLHRKWVCLEWKIDKSPIKATETGVDMCKGPLKLPEGGA